jgi:hypothetical protein
MGLGHTRPQIFLPTLLPLCVAHLMARSVQEVYAGARHHRCTAAWVVAPEGFTKGAVELARSVGVSLCDAQSLRGWIRKIDAKERATNAREDNKREGTLASKRPRTVDVDAQSTRISGGHITQWCSVLIVSIHPSS